MQPAVRDEMLNANLGQYAETGKRDMLKALQSTLEGLVQTSAPDIDPKPFVLSCQGHFPSIPESVWAQQDASEFYKQLMIRAEEVAAAVRAAAVHVCWCAAAVHAASVHVGWCVHAAAGIDAASCMRLCMC